MKVTGLTVFPLKSARGLDLKEAVLDGLGIAGDRRWCVRGPDGVVITQREAPVLATLQVRPVGEGLVLRAAERRPLEIHPPGPGATLLTVAVWGSQAHGAAVDPAADSWLSEFLGRPCRLVYLPTEGARAVAEEYGEKDDRVGFADGFPLLLTTEASLADLNRRIESPVPMNRFRANLVVDGSEPFAEDLWRRIRVGDVGFRVVKPCARCVVTTTDQRTGERGREPLRTLATFRNSGGRLLFGQNLIHDGPGRIRLGDPVEVLETGTG